MAGLKVAVVLAVVALCCALGVEAEGRELMIALRHRDPPALKKLFEQVSTPGSAKYGQFLSRDDLAAMVSPSTEDVATLKKWVYRVGGTQAELLESGDLLRITVPESVASLLLDKTRRGSLPAEVKQHIEVVFEDASQKQTRSAALQLSQKIWKVKTNAPAYRTLSTVGSPNEQKKAYGIPLNLKATNSSNLQMVWGPGTFGFSADDLTQFYKKYSVNNDVSLVQTEGNSGQPGGDNFGEGTLDTTYISSIGVGVRTLVSNTNTSSSTEEGLGFGYALLAFVTSLSTRQQLPLVLSMSLGSLSWDSCDMMCNILAKQGSHSYDDCVAYLNTQRQVCMYDSADQIERINTEFMKLGVRGVTLLAATGDGGSHFSFGPFSLFNSIGRALNKISCDYNFPTFPAESPYVLAVGGIQWSQGPQNPVAWTASGGGFSWRFACPDYQKDIVQKYLSSTQLPPKTSFNASNRAYPDVSALATGVPIVMDGMETETGGTSASAPAFAGIISLINDHRLNAQLPPLGFVNYRLYKVATEHPGEAFYDVKQGSSSCSSSGYCCSTGFAGTPGWDPVTGLGSPLWSGLIKYLGSD